MISLGVGGNFGRPEHDAAAALVRDGVIVAAAEEERFIRYKCAFGVMPDQAARYCLQAAHLHISEVDELAFPRNTWVGHEDRLKWWCENSFGGVPKTIRFVEHHLAHAASAGHVSGFANALIVSVDMSGDGVALAVFEKQGFQIRQLHSIPFPNSLGIFMVLITQYLGFLGTQEEGKVMALSQTGEPTIQLDEMLAVTADQYDFNVGALHPEVLKRYPEFHTRQLPYYSRWVESYLPPRRLPGQPLSQIHRNVAASAQARLEQAVLAVISKYRTIGNRNLCLAGGVAQNSVLNGAIVSTGWFDRIYIPPAPGDAGSALGAAIQSQVEAGCTFEPLTTSRLGPTVDLGALSKTVASSGYQNRTIPNTWDLADIVASLLAKGKVVGLVQGRMEFGPRALGGRSLLAHPNDPAAKARLDAIKMREPYRPFAPALLPEACDELLQTQVDAPFMSFTLPTTERGRHTLANAIAPNGSARVQTLSEETGLIHAVTRQLAASSGVPAVVNTSFNGDGQPLVRSVGQALAMFATTPMDALVIDDLLVSKQ